MYNKATLIGRVGQDPEFRQFEGGGRVVSFSLATSENYKDANGNWQEKTEWHRVQAWGKLADTVNQHYGKGDQLLIEGKITYRKYTDKDQIERHMTEINAFVIRRMQKAKSEAPTQNMEHVGGNYEPSPWER